MFETMSRLFAAPLIGRCVSSTQAPSRMKPAKAPELMPERALSHRANAPLARSQSDIAKKLADHEGLNSPQPNAQILQWCGEAAERFDDARIQTFVPILVQHIVNNRIHREHES
ncbi:three-helix bundle dimerization domain-containing protein [Mycolicibacterium fortuitum]|uniref:three-helix bundle dimerization domain-containing protein n=1 Tax=Mycolicibacterium fortuitum TaxID=1766 RepID=UPI001CE1F963|nr:hypothetical protein [Mycolicibacterium fortuitum]MCA4726608.1 hypothetical protein [Mycolicibacterium fortuitum]